MDTGGLCVDDLGRLELAAAADAPGRVAACEVRGPPRIYIGIVAEAFGREGAVPVVAAVVAVSAPAALPAVSGQPAVPVVLVAGRARLKLAKLAGFSPTRRFVGVKIRSGVNNTMQSNG